uniref:Fucolectin n=1 Tax=Hemiscolopendra marginata TaxID=943146 RepID=A0A646QCC4_9MYRI
MTVTCLKKLLGKSIRTHLYRVCDMDPIIKCQGSKRVEIHYETIPRGYEVPNLAEGKQTRQIYTDEGGIPSFANDEHISETISKNGLTLCSYAIEKDEKNPWWRVDLDHEYIVEFLGIFNNHENPGYLHDIEIRVGNKDIEKVFYDDFIEGNPLCKNFLNETLPPGLNFIKCDHPVIGEYVSIEITRKCDKYLNGCYPKNDSEANKLILCEVQVYGTRLEDSKTLDEMATLHYRSTMTEHDKNILLKMGKLEIFSNEMETRNLNWWIISVNLKTIEVTKVKLFFDKGYSTEDLKEIPLEILVGFTYLETEQSFFYGHFNSTTTWFSAKGKRTIVEEGQLKAIIIQPKYRSIGIYITIIAPGDCKRELCDSISAVQIEEFQVTANEIHRVSSRKNELNPVSSTPTCTHTSAMHTYPWWKAKFSREVIVESVTIWNTKDNSSELLREIEIRVGIFEIRYSDAALQSNQICYKGDTSLEELKNPFTCDPSLFGEFLTIQIVPKDPIHNRYNILTLCKVEVRGKQIREDKTKAVPNELTHNESGIILSRQ